MQLESLPVVRPASPPSDTSCRDIASHNLPPAESTPPVVECKSEGGTASGDLWSDKREELRVYVEELERTVEACGMTFDMYPAMARIWVGVGALPGVRAWRMEVEAGDSVRLDFEGKHDENDEQDSPAQEPTPAASLSTAQPTPQEPTPQEPTPQEPTPQEPTPQEVPSQEPTPPTKKTDSPRQPAFWSRESRWADFPLNPALVADSAWPPRPVAASRLVPRTPSVQFRQERKTKKKFGLC